MDVLTPTKDEIITDLKASLLLHSNAIHLLIQHVNDHAGDVKGWYIEPSYQSTGDVCWLAPTYSNDSDSFFSTLRNSEAITAYLAMADQVQRHSLPIKPNRQVGSKTNKPFKDYLKSITGVDCHDSIDNNFELWLREIQDSAIAQDYRVGRNGHMVFNHDIDKILTVDGMPHRIELEVCHYHDGDEITEQTHGHMLESGLDSLSPSEPYTVYWWRDVPVG